MKKPAAKPPLGTQKKSVRMPPFSIRFDQAEKEAIEKAGAAEDRSAAYIIRRVMREWLKDKGFLRF